MGKQKRQRSMPHKKHPTGLPSVKDFEMEESEDITNEDRESVLQRVYDEVGLSYKKKILFDFLNIYN